MLASILSTWLDKEKIESQEYKEFRKAALALESKYNVFLMIEVNWTNNLPESISTLEEKG